MKKVYSSYDSLMVWHLKNVLEIHGIHPILKGEYLTGVAGEVPPIECWPEIWVVEDSQYDYARKIIETALNSKDSPSQPWKCSGCGEEIDGQFTECWSCGKSHS